MRVPLSISLRAWRIGLLVALYVGNVHASPLRTDESLRSRCGGWRVPTSRILVKFRPGVERSEILELFSQQDGTIVERPGKGRAHYMVRFGSSGESRRVADKWRASSLVEWCQVDWIRESRKKYLPTTEPLFKYQWHLHNTGTNGIMINRDLYMERAWDITQGDPSVVVAVLDDGVQLDHIDLAGSVFINLGEYGGGKQTNSIDDDGNGYVDDWRGWDFIGSDNDPSPADPEDNHGTAVAGLICAPLDNTNGIAGVAGRCRFLPIRIAIAGASDSDWADAIRYAASFDEVAVLSISASLAPAAVIYEALRYAVTEGRNGLGAVVCMALGNDGVMRRFSSDAAAAPEVITVSGSTDYDRRAWLADYGPPVNVVCPSGGGRLSLVTTDRTAADGYEVGDYTTTFGATSASCSLAAGVAALLAHQHPTWTGLEIRRTLEATCDRIDAVAHPYNVRGWNETYGHGRVNAWASLVAGRGQWDTYEPDNSQDSAALISDGELQYRSLSTTSDLDYAWFSVAEQTDVQIVAIGATNMFLTLFDSATNVVATDDGGGASFSGVAADDLAAGTYYIQVEATNGVSVSQYALHYARLNFLDAYESDNSSTVARTVSPRMMQYRTMYPTGDVDWAKFTLTNNCRVEIRTMGEWNGWLEMSLWSNGTQIAYRYNDSPRTHIDTNLVAGTYHIRLNEVADYEVTSYQLLLEVYEMDAYENDDSFLQAVPMSSGERISRTFHSTNDQDWITFTLTNRSNVLIMTDTGNPLMDPYQGDTWLWLYESDGSTLIASDDDGNNRYFSAVYKTGLDPGTYYAKVRTAALSNEVVCANYYIALDTYENKTEIVIGLSTNGIELAWNGDASYIYPIEYTDSILSTQSWSVLTNVEGRVGNNVWEDTDAGSAAIRYYRIRSP